MNENIDLTKILKDCPKGTKLYSIAWGDVIFEKIAGGPHPIIVRIDKSITESYSADGKIYNDLGECSLYPSKDQRDWSQFTAPWLKKERFDPKTMSEFDKVLARITKDGIWCATFFSHYDKEVKWGYYKFVTTSSKSYSMCIPYNEDTKHLVGTNEEAPEYYRYWED